MNIRPARWIILSLLASALFVSSCGEETGPSEPIQVDLALAPAFASQAAGIIPIGEGIFEVLAPNLDGQTNRTVWADTVSFAPNADSVVIELTVTVTNPDVRYFITASLYSTAGDLLWCSTSAPFAVGRSPMTTVPLTFVYCGVGANASGVRILEQPVPIYAGDTLVFTAEAFDAQGAIAGAPIVWSTPDAATATVPDPLTGRMIGGPQSGNARIIAMLLTGQADTVVVPVRLPPTGLIVDTGNNQSAPADSTLAQPIVARVTAADGSGVPGIWVGFAVTSGGGSVSPDSVLTDATGRAAVNWTLGPAVGTQTLQLSSSALPGVTPTVMATAVSVLPGGITITAGNNQIAPTGTAVPVAPAVLVADLQNNPLVGASVVFTVTGGGGSVTGDTVLTDGAGMAAVGSWVLGTIGVVQTLEVTVTGLSPVTFGATATNNDGAVAIAILAGNNQIIAVDSVVTIPPSVLVTGPGGSPVAGAAVLFAVTAGNGSLTAANAITDAAGIATVGSWKLGQTAGPNTLDATAPSIPPVSFAATGTARAATALAIVGGEGQTADNGMSLPLPMEVESQDLFGNAVGGVNVTWIPTDGSVNPTTGTTDAQGRAQTTWTLGSNVISPTLTAQSPGLQSVVFTATTNFPNPVVLMSLVGTNRIRVGDSAQLQVTLTAPAGAGGITVGIASDAPAVIQVSGTPSIVIPQGGTTGTIMLLAISSGTTTVRATATGYTDGALSVLGSLQVLSVPATLNVPFGGTASMPITLSTPAAAGGEVINLSTTVPGNVGLVSSTVTVPAGQTTINATVQGVTPGSSVVTASSLNYGSSQTTVSTTANLNVVQASLTTNANFPSSVTIRLESGGSQIAAPGPGISVTMTPVNPACVAAVSPVTIPTGLVDTVSTMSYGGSATLPCTSWVVATASGIAPDSVNVTVNPPPPITLSATTDVGSGLIRAQSGFIGQIAPAITTVRLVSSDSSLILVSNNAAAVGSGSVDVVIPQNQQSFTYWVHGLEGQTGTVDIVATSAGYVPDTAATVVRQPALDIISLSTSTTSLSVNDAFQVRIGIPNAQLTGMQVEEPLRPGGPAIVATVATSDSAIAALVTASLTSDTVTVGIASGLARSPTTIAAGGMELDLRNPGMVTISATSPGYAVLPTASAVVNITAPLLTLFATTTTGAGLQRSQSGQLGAPAPAGTVVRLVSADSAVLLLSPNTTTPGGGTLDIPLQTGFQSFTYYTNGIENQVDTVFIYGSAPGFTPDTVTNAVWQPAVDLINVNTTTTSLTVPDLIQARIGVPNAAATAMSVEQTLRPGAAGLAATFMTSDVLVAELESNADTGQTVIVALAPLDARTPSTVAAGGVALDPLTAGVTTVSTTIPGYITLPTASQNVTVTAPVITLFTTTTVGAGLIRQQSGTLSATAPDTTIVTLVSADSSVMQLSPNATTPGTGTVVDTLFPGQSSILFYTQGVEGTTGTVDIVASSPGYVPDTIPAVVVQPAIDLISLNPTITTLTANDAFQARIGVPNAGLNFMSLEQPIRPGGATITVTATNSQSGVAQLVTTALSGQSVTATIVSGAARSPGTLALGGFEFEPLATGATTVQVTSAPAYVTLPTASAVVNVTSPAITLGSPTSTGSGLMRQQSGNLAAPAPAGTMLVIKSSNPSVALISLNQTVAGTDSIVIPLNTGVTSFTYWTHGLEGQTGTVTVTASAAGYTDGTTPIPVVQPAFDLTGLNANTTTLSPEDVFQIRVGVPNGTNTLLSFTESVRIGGIPPTFTVTNSNPAVGELVTLPDTAQSVVVTVPAGSSASLGTVASGGVALKPLGVGTTDVAATGTGFIALPNAMQSVTVAVPVITINTLTDVGAGLQESHSISLGAAAPPGLIVRITSSDPATMLVAPNVSTPATAFIDFPVNTGAFSFTYYTAGVEGTAGATSVYATATGYAGDTLGTNVVQPALEIIALLTTTTVGAADDPFYVRPGTPNAQFTALGRVQEIRAGAAPLTVTLMNSGAAGQLVTTAATGQTVTVDIPPQGQNSPTSVATGGAAFDGIAAGTATVSASATGYGVVTTGSVTVLINP